MKRHTRALLGALSFPMVLSSCAVLQGPGSPGTPAEVSAAAYAQDHTRMGTVLLDANWGRRWGCAGFDNAQLISFAFDRLPLQRAENDPETDLVIGTSSRLAVSPAFVSLAVMVPPGVYALSNVRIKVASQALGVGYYVATRKDLMAGGKPNAGTFKVAAGETVYIGNFGLACLKNPTLWRYYAEDRAQFKNQLAGYQQKYPFLDVQSAKYRLFDTTLIGRAHALK